MKLRTNQTDKRKLSQFMKLNNLDVNMELSNDFCKDIIFGLKCRSFVKKTIATMSVHIIVFFVVNSVSLPLSK